MIYLLPFIGALIGWITNLLAVKMLFRPYNPINIGIANIQGVIPRRQKDLGKSVGELVANELISADEVKNVLKEQALSRRTMDKISQKVEEAISHRLPDAIPTIAMLVNPQLVHSVRGMFLDDLQKMVAELVNQFAEQIDKELNIAELVEEKINSYSAKRMEELAVSIMKKEFRFIEATGAALGFLIGIAQVALFVTLPEYAAW